MMVQKKNIKGKIYSAKNSNMLVLVALNIKPLKYVRYLIMRKIYTLLEKNLLRKLNMIKIIYKIK